MPSVELKRSSEIEFTFTGQDGVKYEATIPAITVGQYRRAIALEAEGGKTDPMERLVKQAEILCGTAHLDFVHALDPEQLAECVQALVAVYAGLDAEAIVELQRQLKKKSLLEMVLGEVRGHASQNSTS